MNITEKNWLLAQANQEKTPENAASVINLSKLKPGQGFAINGTEKTELVLLETVSNAGDV